MKKRFLQYFIFIGLILLVAVGCSSNKELIRQTVREEMKNELKDVNDFLNVAYGFNAYKRGLRNGSITPNDIKNLENLSDRSDGGVINLDEINKKIAYELSKIDQQVEFKLIQVDNQIDVRIDKKLSKVQEAVHDNSTHIKAAKLDMKSNQIDISQNKMNIKNNAKDIHSNILENVTKNKVNIASNRKEISSLRRSSEKLLLNINKVK